ITVRALLGLLAARADRPGTPAGAPAALAGLLARFRRELGARLDEADGAGVPAEAAVAEREPLAAEVAAQVAATERLLAAGEARFTAGQARLADAVVEALAAGDAAGARAALDRKERGQYVPLHDRLVRFMAESFGWVLE